MIDWSMAKMNEIRIRTDTLVVHIVNHPHHYLIYVETQAKQQLLASQKQKYYRSEEVL